MNRFVLRYYQRRNEGFSPMEAYGLIASGIAVSGTYEDLLEVDRVVDIDMKKRTEELLNEPIARTISAAK